MAHSLNRVQLIGNLGKDPEIRTTQSGTKIVNFTLATSERWKDKASGEQKERTEWHRVVIFNEGLAGVVERFVKKGSKIYIEGQLQTRKWADQAGVDHYATEVVLAQFNGNLILLDRADGTAETSRPSISCAQACSCWWRRSGRRNPVCSVLAMIDDPLPHLRLLARTVPAADAAGIALLRAKAEIATLRAENAELKISVRLLKYFTREEMPE